MKDICEELARIIEQGIERGKIPNGASFHVCPDGIWAAMEHEREHGTDQFSRLPACEHKVIFKTK